MSMLAMSKNRLLNYVHCIQFSPANFIEEVKRASLTPQPDSYFNTQATYIAHYLSRLDAKSLVIETHYIDRHYMEEVSLYYSKCLNAYRNYTTRIHVFKSKIDDPKINHYIKESAGGKYKEINNELQQNYCGYVVVRPLPSVPIGRTVLSHIENNEGRDFSCCYTYPVHFLGFRLRVRSLAFQQQDRAVAACATTAVWSALQKASRRDGQRPPTSWSITQAAVTHYLPEGRPFPSPGLTLEQVCDAIRNFEFAADLFWVRGNAIFFLLMLNIYLKSGIPAILALEGETEGHAVAAVGYKQSKLNNINLVNFNSYQVDLKNLIYDRIYIHDDRIGPFAKSGLDIHQNLDQDSNVLSSDLYISTKIPTEDNDELDRRKVLFAVTPLYPKLRSNAKELIFSASELIPIISSSLNIESYELGIDMFFSRPGEYQHGLWDMDIDPDYYTNFIKNVVLSRYIGVIRWFYKDVAIIDTVWDTTDTLRETRYNENLLGIVCFDKTIRSLVDGIGDLFSAPVG